MNTIRHGGLVALALVALTFAGCSSGGESASSVASVDDIAAPTSEVPADTQQSLDETDESADDTLHVIVEDAPDATDEELALEFVACMRDEGVEMDDPTLNSDGTINLFGGGEGNIRGEGFEEAAQECTDIIQDATFFAARRDLSEAGDDLLAFAQCLRDQGLDVEDPDLSAEDQGGGVFGDSFDPRDPANADAVGQCQGLVNFGGGG